MRSIPRATVLALFLAPLSTPAQELCASGGQLGGTLDFELTGPVGDLWFLLFSQNTGPTPLALVDPADPRVLEVGIDLLPFAQSGVFVGSTAQTSVPMPANLGLHGSVLHAQFLTFPGTTTTFDVLSNRVDAQLGVADQSLHTLGTVQVPRQGHSVTALPGDRVLVAGGDQTDGAGGLTTLATAEVYDPKTGTFALTGSLSGPRSTHTATALLDGRVLICGGYDDEAVGAALATCEIYDPTTDTFSAAASMSESRSQHSATLLAGGANAGKVLVVGGIGLFDLDNIFPSLATGRDTTEIYDPTTDTWTAGPLLDLPRFAHSASSLNNGRILVVSGVEVAPVFGIPTPSFTNDCRLYRHAQNDWLPASSLPGTGGIAYASQVTTASGSPLVAGGANGNLLTLVFTTLTQGYRYTPATDSWTLIGNLNGPRAYAQLLRAGDDLLCVGGLSDVDALTATGTPQQRIERSTDDGLTWTSTTTMQMLLPREVSRSAVIDGGQRLLTIGVANGGLAPIDTTAEVFLQD